MEQSGGYWMWTRSSSNLMNMSDQRKSVHDDQSWEEQAFAEDSAGHLGGGCVWPPRSYTCSFCRREFRSAQALGGHMNVHRRDRARLKQYPLLTHDHSHPPLHINQTIVLDHQHPFTSLSTGIVQNPSQVCSTSLVVNPNPKSNPRFAAPPPPRVVSASSTQDYSNTNKQLTKSLVSPSYSLPIVHESLFSNPSIRSEHSIMPTRFLIVSGSSKHNEEDESLKEMENTRPRIHGDGECIELNPSGSLSLVSRCVSRSRGGLDVDDDDHDDGVDEGMLGKKRRRTDEESSLPPFFLNNNFINRNIRLKSEELLGLKQSSIIEELDLELRLGDQPTAKVK